MTFTELLGESLQGKDGKTIPTAEALADKDVIGLYFSAHWCGPCRGFTPVLARSYEKIAQKHKFEIVFVSSDRDDKSFEEYFGEMPWLALPFANRDAKQKLSKKYKVEGIPTLVLLDGKTGKTITKDGRSTITEDGEGEKFPWIKPPVNLFDLLGENLVGKPGQVVSTKSVFESSDAVGLYFSAHWCGPCRGFTPKLAETYNKLKEDGKHKFEIIFVSSDQDQKAFDEYFGEMPWLALPYDNRDAKSKLSDYFGVRGIPTFVILDKNGKTINKDGRGAVSGDPQGADFPWSPKPANSIASPAGINDTPSLVLFTEKADEATRTALREDLFAVAKEIHSKAPKSDDDEEQDLPALFFFAEDEDNAIAKRVRGLIKFGEPTNEPQAVLLDLGDNGGFYPFPSGEQINKQSLQKFVEDFLAGSLKEQRKQLDM